MADGNAFARGGERLAAQDWLTHRYQGVGGRRAVWQRNNQFAGHKAATNGPCRGVLLVRSQTQPAQQAPLQGQLTHGQTRQC